MIISCTVEKKKNSIFERSGLEEAYQNSAIFLNSPLSETVKLGDYINQGCCDSLSNVLDKI